jgi:hypothetical protein
MTMGETKSKTAAACDLVWMQLVAFLLAIGLSANPQAWLTRPCFFMIESVGKIGICEAGTTPGHGKEPAFHLWDVFQKIHGGQESWDADLDTVQKQIIYRAEAAALLCFIFLLVLSASGCGKAAARSCPAGKVLTVPILFVVLLFAPNSMLSSFASVAGVLAPLFFCRSRADGD